MEPDFHVLPLDVFSWLQEALKDVPYHGQTAKAAWAWDMLLFLGFHSGLKALGNVGRAGEVVLLCLLTAADSESWLWAQ